MEFINLERALDYILLIATKKNISQRKLIEGICDYSHFNKMCNKKRTISLEIIINCVNKLEISPTEVIINCSDEYIPNYQVIKGQCEFYLLTQQFDELHNFYEKLNSHNIENPHLTQLLIRIRGILEAQNGNYNYAIELFIKAIKQTNNNFKLNFDKIFSSSEEEINILHDIALAYYYLNDYDNSIKIFKIIMNFFETKKFIINTFIFPKICYSLGLVYEKNGDFDKLLEISQLGVTFCLSRNSYGALGYLYFNVAISYATMNEKKLAKEFCEKSINIFKTQNRNIIFFEKLHSEMKKYHIN